VRSCHFSNLFCFDTSTRDYVVFADLKHERILQQHASGSPLLDVSQSYLQPSLQNPTFVSIGGINQKWNYGATANEGMARLRWFPEIRDISQLAQYYELPPQTVMIPFHSMNAANPGHLVWDDWLPIYTLLTMFQVLPGDPQLLLMRYILPGEKGLWASCDVNEERTQDCHNLQRKFLPLMVGTDAAYQEEMPTNHNFDFHVIHPQQQQSSSSTLVCAKRGLAGIGGLTDHGTEKLHGWEDKDYEVTQNHGRGGMLYEFRNFMVQNLGLAMIHAQTPPFRIVFSEASSSAGHRNLYFTKHKQLVQSSFHSNYVLVESYVMSELSLQQQVEIASQTSIFITMCGGGAVTSMFLPRGSSVIMFYLEYGGMEGGRPSNNPARLDWDLFNNLAYLKVHWLPKGTMQHDDDLRAFLLLIQHELDGLVMEKAYNHFFQ
jgi:hypothetical protein